MSQTTDDQGQAEFQLSGSKGDVIGLVLQPGANPTLPVSTREFNPLTYTYMYLRILPADHDIAAKDPTWANVHNFIMSNWEAMAPCMDIWLSLGDQAQVKAHASILKKLTNPDNFESFRFMPVTRDMTRGQRSLLYNWLDAGTTKLESAAAEEENDYGALSGAMRGQ